MNHSKNKSSWFNQEEAGTGIQSGGCEVVPFSKSAGLVGDHGGWIWNRPSKVVIRNDDEIKSIPVINLTRLIQIFLFSLSFMFSLIGIMSFLRTQKKESK